MAVAFSSLRDLFCGDDDCAPVYEPGLVALICDGLEPEPSNPFTVAEKLFPELEHVAPRSAIRYIDEIGTDAYKAIKDGFDLWKSRGKAKAA